MGVMEDQIFNFVEERDYVTFVEIQREFSEVMDVKGKYALETCKNGILWVGLSEELHSVLRNLLVSKRIYAHPASRLTYLVDGACLSLPTPKNLPKDGLHVGYEQPVWIPSCLRVCPYDPQEERVLRSIEKSRKAEEKRGIKRGLERMIKLFGEDKVVRELFSLEGDPMKLWASKYGLKQARGPVCAARLLGKKCSGAAVYREGKCLCRPPGSDHETLWCHEGKPVVYVFQPYGLSGSQMDELSSYCQKWGFQMTVDTWPAWHYPGRILFVEIYKRGGVFETLGMKPPLSFPRKSAEGPSVQTPEA